MDIDREFGPIFNDTYFLKPLLALQKSIQNLTAPDGTTLKDVCLHPLVQSDVCMLQSFWSYFQDNATRLDEIYVDKRFSSYPVSNPDIDTIENYLDHFIACAG